MMACSARPIRRLILWVRPDPARTDSRSVRSCVDRSIAYSAVTHPSLVPSATWGRSVTDAATSTLVRRTHQNGALGVSASRG